MCLIGRNGGRRPKSLAKRALSRWQRPFLPGPTCAPTTGRAQSPKAAALDLRLRSTKLLCNPALLRRSVDCALTQDRTEPSIIFRGKSLANPR
jgi:hypothetical protein